MNAIVVFCTIPGDQARDLARFLVEERGAACVNIVPSVRSVYRWEGEIVEDEEALLVIKTAEENFPRLQALIKERHPYTVPEIIALRVAHGDPDYLSWLEAER